VSEKQFMQAIIDLAKFNQWLVYHTFDSRRSAYGFPDLVLVKPPRVIFAEVKSEKGKLTPYQELWLEILGQCPGIETYVWRPKNREKIEWILGGYDD
jgi:hypothetical protein